MFEQTSKKNTEITLIVFPNLSEFLAVDARSQLPGRPMVHSLDLSDVTGSHFADSIENEFSIMVRERERGFIGLMGIPSKVEDMVRTRLIRNVIDLISQDAGEQGQGEEAGVGVLFFTGPLLRIDAEQVKQLAEDLFGERLPVSLKKDLSDMIWGLMESQLEAEQATAKSFLGELISGKGGPYATLWERQQD